MAIINDGGPAFPTLRDVFAGQALAGWLAGVAGQDFMDEYDNDERAWKEHQAAVGKLAYGYADALLAAREVQP